MSQWTPSQECAMHLRGHDILVSAAAGSGKTATLTERIIRALTETTPDGRHTGDISRMLIVTFTRAAAAELRARISAALSAAIAAHPDDRYLYRQLVALGSAHICTIDSFYLEPVRANFERLGLPSAFRLADDTELFPIKEQVLDRLIEEGYAAAATAPVDPDAPLASLAGNTFALAMDDLLPNRDRGDTARVLLSLYEKLVAFPEGIERLHTSACRLEADAQKPFGLTSEGQLLTRSLCAELQYDCEILRPICDLLRRDERTASKYLPSFAHDLDTAEQLLRDLENGYWEAAAARAEGYAPISLKTLKNAAEIIPDIEDIKAVRTDITKALRTLPARYFSESTADMAASQRRTARTQHMLYRLLSDYDRAIREEKIRRGVLDFSDVRRYLLQLLLDENGVPTDIARSLQDRFDAVYIDEYQDVDTVQDRIFATIGQGGKRFMVGDIKQSIYSFRGAEPSIFADYRKAFRAVTLIDETDAYPNEGLCVFMSENFRCDRSVIDFTNTVCRHTFSVCADSLGYSPADDLILGKQSNTPTVPVELILLEQPSKEEREDAPTDALNPEAVYIADEIARLLREGTRGDGKTPLRPSDCAVLMRSTGAARDVTLALAAHGISTSFAAAKRLSDDPDMLYIIHLLSVIDNPRDDVPLTGFLTGGETPLSLSELLLLRRPDHAASLYDDICAAVARADTPGDTAADLPPIPDDLLSRMRDFLAKLSDWRELAATLPADKLLRRLSSESPLSRLASTPSYLCLYDRARAYQNSSFCSLYTFMQHLRRWMEDPNGLSAAGLQSSEDAVTILSIHKSKGLQFPVVFVLGCASDFNREDLHGPVMFDPALGAAAKQYIPETAQLRETVTRRAIASLTRVRQTEEEMRLLYVALTRAQERLYVTAKLRGSAESAFARARRPGSDTRFSVLSCTRYLDWMLPPLLASDTQGERPIIRILSRADYQYPHPVADQPTDVATQEKPDAPAQNPYRDILARHAEFHDPAHALRVLPTKAAASKLRTALLDSTWLAEELQPSEADPHAHEHPSDLLGDARDAKEILRRRIELIRADRPTFDALLEQNRTATAAERGTATHLFLQHCDFARLDGTHDSLMREIDRLIEQKKLPRRAADLLQLPHLLRLGQSPLIALCRAARHMWREQHFDRFVPYSALTADRERARALKDYTLYVQGSIDLLLEDAGGEVWLIDYKTDRIHATEDAGIREELLAHHADQLRIYAEAAAGLLSRRPDHIAIYSLPLGRVIELTDALPNSPLLGS